MLDRSYERAEWKGDRVRARMRDADTAATERVWLTVGKCEDGDCIEEQARHRQGCGDDAYAAFRRLDEGMQPDAVLLCCGNCCFLQLTGMSRQMSGGRTGYCLAYLPEHGRSSDDLVSIFDFCNCFAYGPGELAEPMRRHLWQEQARPCGLGEARNDGE